jgi:hypothetical protein
MKKKIYLLPILSSILVLLLFYQNCAQTGFPVNEETNQSLLEEPLKQQFPEFNLMSANQIYQTFLGLTGQSQDTPNQRAEFNQRKSSFSDQGEVQAINAPYLLAAVSLAGTSCEVLVQRERNLADADRSIFSGINFGTGVSMVTDGTYIQAMNKMARSFWNMSLDQNEISALVEYKRSYTEGVTDGANQTINLMISSCSALLGNIRVLAL